MSSLAKKTGYLMISKQCIHSLEYEPEESKFKTASSSASGSTSGLAFSTNMQLHVVDPKRLVAGMLI